MLMLPFRLLASLALALFCYSRLVRRAVAGIAVSATIVAFQHEAVLRALAQPADAHGGLAGTLRVLALLAGG